MISIIERIIDIIILTLIIVVSLYVNEVRLKGANTASGGINPAYGGVGTQSRETNGHTVLERN